MSCPACERRRRALERARSVTERSVNSNQKRTVQQPTASCTGCVSRVTPEGWVNVCPICYGTSKPTPFPTSKLPECKPNCKRNQ